MKGRDLGGPGNRREAIKAVVREGRLSFPTLNRRFVSSHTIARGKERCAKEKACVGG